MRTNLPETFARPTFDYKTTAQFGTYRTFATTARVTHVVRSIAYSYDDTPSAGWLLIDVNAATPRTLFKIDIPVASRKQLLFPGGIYGLAGEQLRVGVGAPGVGKNVKTSTKVYSMHGLPEVEAAPTFFNHSPAANTAATTGDIAAAAGVTHVLDWVYWSFDRATGQATSLTITAGTTTLAKVDIVSGFSGVGEPLIFPGGIYGSANELLNVTLSADNGGAIGKLNVRYR